MLELALARRDDVEIGPFQTADHVAEIGLPMFQRAGQAWRVPVRQREVLGDRWAAQVRVDQKDARLSSLGERAGEIERRDGLPVAGAGTGNEGAKSVSPLSA